MSQGYDKLDTTGNIVAATITLTSLANSASAGRQSSVITLVDGNQRVPPIIDIDFWCKLATGTVANDKSAYLFMARSVDETNYESGPPNVGASDAAFTFSNSPVGTTPLPTDLRLIGSITFNAQSEAHRHQFQIVAPPPKLVFVVLNYSGIAFTSTGSDHGIQIRKRWPELV